MHKRLEINEENIQSTEKVDLGKKLKVVIFFKK